jgi:hypothetical protein
MTYENICQYVEMMRTYASNQLSILVLIPLQACLSWAVLGYLNSHPLPAALDTQPEAASAP